MKSFYTYKKKFLLLLISAIFIFNKQNFAFERNVGFWSNPKQELSTNFFEKLTDPKSQREHWYKVSPYIAEFWCTLSNIGFLYVGIKNKSPEITFAGLASILSHSIPKQWLLYMDKIGVALVLSKAIREHKIIQKNPHLISLILLASAINATDAYLARNKSQTWPHVIWHLSSAFFADKFLQLTKQN